MCCSLMKSTFSPPAGKLLHSLIDMNLTTISPVNKPHPRKDLIVSGSSRSLYLWSPSDENADDDGVQQPAGPSGSGTGAEATSSIAAMLQRAGGNFVFFDADANDVAKKKRKKSGKGDDGNNG